MSSTLLKQLVLEDILFGLLWLAATCAMLRAAFRISRQAFPNDGHAQTTLHAGVVFVGMCILSLTILGAFGMLYRGTIIAGAFAVAFLLQRLRPVPAETPPTEAEPAGAWLVWAALAALLAGHTVVHGLLRFPDDFDCLMYHLPFIDVWLQTHSLAATASSRWGTPANSELLGVWFAGPFTGDFLTGLNNIPVMIVWASGLLELSRRFGLSGWWRHIAAIACLAVYTSVHETDDASNDLMVAAFFVSGIAYALRFQQSRGSADLVLFGVCLGVLAGTKYFAVGYATLLGSLFVVIGVLTFGWRSSVKATLCAVALSLCFGGYWFARNYAMTGYPLYPTGSPVLREQIPYPDMSKTTLAFNGSPEVPKLAMQAIWTRCGPIHFAAVALTPALAFFYVVVALSRRARREEGDIAAGSLAIALLGCLAIILITPMLVEDQPGTLNHLRWAYTPIRYGLCYLCMAVLALALSLQQIAQVLPAPLRRAIVLAGGIAALTQLAQRFWTERGYEMNLAAFVGIDLLALAVSTVFIARLPRWGTSLATVLIACSVGAGVGALSERWHTGFDAHFNKYFATKLFSDLHQADSRRILVLDGRPYPYFGSRRQHFINQPRQFDGAEAVKSFMADWNADLVVTRVELHKQISRYRPAWDVLEADPAFTLKATGRDLRLFEFTRAANVAIADIPSRNGR